MSTVIPAVIDTATFRRLFLIILGMSPSSIPAVLDTATFRRLSLQATSAGGGVGSTTSTIAPSSVTDFSMFEGGVAPASGTYIAFDNLNIWTLKGGETQWSSTPR